MKNSTYSVLSQIVSTVKKSHATIPSAWALRNCVHVGPQRRGAGPSPPRRSSVLTVVALIRMPSLRSSPQILTQPQRGSPWPCAAPARPPQDRAVAGQACVPSGRSTCAAPARDASAAASAASPGTTTPTAAGKRTACRRQEDPVEWGEPGASGGATQHPELLQQHEDLQVFGRLVSAWEDELAGKHADDQPEYEEHRRMVRSPWSRCESEFPRPTGCGCGEVVSVSRVSHQRRWCAPFGVVLSLERYTRPPRHRKS